MRRYVELFRRMAVELPNPLGLTDWFSVSQVEADVFAHLIRDYQPIHNDPGWCAVHAVPRRTIVHPLHLLSFTANMLSDVGLPISTTDEVTAFNYGFDRVEWPSPLLVGQDARGHVRLMEIQEREADRYLVRTHIRVEIKESDSSALLGENLMYFMPVGLTR